ncbi:ribosome-binding factor A [Candidatus Wolfebacteria bacterium]|nr:ribosome-binding factor A [Candidatus Wolfebacteria bacterium]
MTDRQKKIREEMMKIAGEYISREANRNNLITVTDASISPDLKQLTIFVSVYPNDNEQGALAFLKRHRNDFRSFVKQRISFKVLPFVDFKIDEGEKNRQRIDEILRGEE